MTTPAPLPVYVPGQLVQIATDRVGQPFQRGAVGKVNELVQQGAVWWYQVRVPGNWHSFRGDELAPWAAPWAAPKEVKVQQEDWEVYVPVNATVTIGANGRIGLNADACALLGTHVKLMWSASRRAI